MIAAFLCSFAVVGASVVLRVCPGNLGVAKRHGLCAAAVDPVSPPVHLPAWWYAPFLSNALIWKDNRKNAI